MASSTPPSAPPAMNDFVLQVPLSRAPDELSPHAKRAVIAGMVGAHVLAGWALLQVQAVREAVVEVMPTMMVELIAPTPETPPPPPPKVLPKPPPPAPVLAAKPKPVAEPSPFVAPPPPPEPPPLAAPMAPPAPVMPPAPPAPPAPAPAAPKPVVLTDTDWLKQITPIYPLASQRLNEQGNVLVRALIDTQGVPRQLKVHRSSGFPRLDEAALAAASQSRVKPRTQNGVPFEFPVLMPFGFELDR